MSFTIKKYNFAFIHIPRTSGTSITQWFSNLLEKRNEYHLAKFSLHYSACGNNKHSLNIPDNYTTCSVIRNPWDRMVSIYEFDKYFVNLNLSMQSQGANFGYRVLHGCKYFSIDMSFSSWIKNIYKHYWSYPDHAPFWYTPSTPQTEWLPYDPDILIRFENLKDGYDKIYEFMNCVGHPIKIPHLLKTDRKSYRDYYTDETRKIVEDVFLDDIQRWGYNF